MASQCYRVWEIVQKDPLGNLIRLIPDAYSVKATLGLNKAGIVVLELPSVYCSTVINGYAASDFGEDDRIEIWLGVNGAKSLFGETCFFVSRIVSERQEDGRRVVTVEAESAISLLERRINPFNADDPKSNLVDLLVDNQMKFVVGNNYSLTAGSYAANPDPVRTPIAGVLAIQAATGAALNNWREDIENSTILDVLQDAAQFSFNKGQPLFFDIVQPTAFGNLEFRTYVGQRGVDRTLTTGGANSFVALPELDTISDYALEFNWQGTANRVYAGGEGTGAGRTYVVAEDPTLAGSLAANPWRTRESFLGANSSDPVDIQNEADAELQANRAIVQATGTIGETGNSCYGVDYNFGDIITVIIEGNQLDVHISDVTLDLSDRQEKLEVRFTTELNRKLQDIGSILQEIAGVKRNIRKLEVREY